jgi:hypothetical protein
MSCIQVCGVDRCLSHVASRKQAGGHMQVVVTMLASAWPTVGWCILGFVVIFMITAAAGSDGGTLSKDFPWQV